MFPKFKKNISDLIEDEEGNIPGNKLLMLGTMIVVLGSMMQMDAVQAVHGSHKSHASHQSGSSGSHGNANHSSHRSHSSHSSHSNHSNHASHSNGTSGTYTGSGSFAGGSSSNSDASAAASVPTIKSAPATANADTFKLAGINQTIQLPNGTPASSAIPTLAVPTSSSAAQVDAQIRHQPSATEKIK
ncbi:Uncharacterised protein [Catenibacterium mitsuokai]|nr:Uncharacterised protein [Catenibacterium mitsuokai]